MHITHEEDNQSMLCEILEKNANEIPVILRPGTSKRKQTASMYISNEQAAKKISDSQMMSLTSPSLLELYNEEEFDDSEKDPDYTPKEKRDDDYLSDDSMHREEFSHQDGEDSDERSIEDGEKGTEHKQIKMPKKLVKVKSKKGEKRIYQKKIKCMDSFQRKRDSWRII